MSGNLTVTGATTLGSTLSVGNQAYFHSDVSFNSRTEIYDASFNITDIDNFTVKNVPVLLHIVQSLNQLHDLIGGTDGDTDWLNEEIRNENVVNNLGADHATAEEWSM